MNRRNFVTSAGAFMAAGGASTLLAPAHGSGLSHALSKPDYALTIAPHTLEVSPGVTVRTVAYNGQVPGPLLRLREGIPTRIDVTNASSVPDLVHWHGLAIDSYNDGAMEEGSPMIAPGSTLRYRFTAKPAGTRWYHTHASAFEDLGAGAYTGQFGFLLVEGKEQPAPYDHEINLAIHHWNPKFVPMVDMLRESSANAPLTSGSDVGYEYATINAHRLGAGEPIRVRRGDRVLLRLLNASATENVVLALPGHSFEVIALDGNKVPRPRSVEVVSLAVAERVDAIVTMDSPGVWILGSLLEKERQMGLGVIFEYAGSKGAPIWKEPKASTWDYTQFANSTAATEPEETFVVTFRDIGPVNGSRFDSWTMNNKSWPHTDRLTVERGKRYRLTFRNGSGDQHPMHLHRHSFEVTSIGDTTISGLRKDVINVLPLDTVSVDFVADNPGDTLLHCHQQLHMDYGFMQLIQYKA